MTKDDSETIVDRTGHAWSVAELEARVSLYEPNIVMIREVPNTTAEIFAVMVEKARELGASQDGPFGVLMDLTEATARPDSDMMRVIMAATESMGVHWAAVPPGSLMFKTLLKFVTQRVARLKNNSIHTNREEAAARIRQALAAHPGARASLRP
ncbi:MAG: hypothetical protein R3B72_00870 [Polyangiaceae bacterium]